MGLNQTTYKNVMELFVDEEIQYQLANNKALSQMGGYLNLREVATFALNRLPTLYASSMEGIERQKRKLKQQTELKRKIALAVSQAFAAVERDPLRRSTPLQEENKDTIEEAKKTISELGTELPTEELAWIVAFMESFLLNVKEKQVTNEEVIKLYYLLYYYWQENQ